MQAKEIMYAEEYAKQAFFFSFSFIYLSIYI